eukprot:250316-Rhodomonas_salina.2
MNSNIEYDGPTVAGKVHCFSSTKWKTMSCAWEDNKDASVFGEGRFCCSSFNYVGEFRYQPSCH